MTCRSKRSSIKDGAYVLKLLFRTMSFHKKATLDIQVDFWRFERIKKA